MNAHSDIDERECVAIVDLAVIACREEILYIESMMQFDTNNKKYIILDIYYVTISCYNTFSTLYIPMLVSRNTLSNEQRACKQVNCGEPILLKTV